MIKKHKKLLISLLSLLVILGGVSGAGYYLTHYYDPVRVIYKRWKAPSPYLYEEIAPHFLRTDPAALITIENKEDAERIRRAAIRVIWGRDDLPRKKMPAAIEKDIEDSRYDGMANLGRIDRIEIKMDYGIRSIGYHFQAADGNGRLVIFHQGFAGTFHDAKHLIGALLGEGYAVIGLNFLGYGENLMGHDAYFPRIGWYGVNTYRIVDIAEHPMQYFFEPVVVAVNYAEKEFAYTTIDISGFSAGGWTAMAAAAIDPRIRRSYPVAGSYPLYLRDRDEPGQSVPQQYYGPFIYAVNYLEMFVLAATGKGRGQLQIFNRFDNCCFNNVKGKHYEQAVRDVVARLGPGRFAVLIDETHADHKISDFAIEAILEDLALP